MGLFGVFRASSSCNILIAGQIDEVNRYWKDEARLIFIGN